ncbi:MAG: dihydrolipoyl dehydrogenase [Ignavibacteriaceae bacterium]|jgi:dihydrolipoamide dehydrogenase|nr:MAG: dihydrolipoyl dehydrogenase [Chlorobiota bacterium]KXK04648.1 MAG: dihydrolipoamide dehydrogenase [Chlorobi bacterium OLB4]MBV6399488.1 Dihydrolipoyl dehydrogenase [Ignavibacteria bacterium]MCC6886668.1 dihydrolipoyl dehydrogenase [Ignavibacteriales bacterium]MCE7953194.1 dihydrolipoyl dehydrogenase [Chlorobi bacterium CHB7]MEB2329024.1 dihydrolipoyl dehydrogenase [Ignavibacteriaceae bacterium]OQY76559.1 MAG: dihydrolipoyl dehydrogenase [Ignavibacteriales bacterium UTCHB1]RIK50064.1 
MQEFDLTVIGSGPGGYTAAIRAAQLGFKTAIIERDKLGGVCLNWGCIPTKALLKSAEVMNKISHLDDLGLKAQEIGFDFPKIIERSRDVADASEKGVKYLMKKNKITVIEGSAKFGKDKIISVSDKTGKEIDKVKSKHTIIATGARARKLPGVEFDEKKILSSTGALIMKEVPKSMVIVGSGAIGAEFAYFYNAFGTDITIIEMLPTILPVEDKDISDVVAREFKKSGIKIYTESKTEEVKIKGNKVKVKVSGKVTDEIEADCVLLAIGVTGNIENLGLEDIGVEVYKNGIKVDKNYQTNVSGVYAIGDCALIDPKGKAWLAHVASGEAVNCVEKIKGLDVADIEYLNIPGCTYCQPQVASVGLTEAKAKEAGYDIKVGKFPFSANGKSRAAGETTGMVKLIFDSKYDELLGAHIVGSEATELISELVMTKSLEGTGRTILQTIHAHPTLSESIMEAAGVAHGEAINI